MQISIDDSSAVPSGEQLRSQLAEMIAGELLPAGSRLPSVRQLAGDLKVAPGTVARAYRDLEASGHLVTSRTGTRVASLGQQAHVERQQHLDQAARRFAESGQRTGVRLTEALDAVRRAYRELPPASST